MTLEEAYGVYNRKYFGGRLPSIPVRWEEMKEASGETRYDPLEIVIHPKLKEFARLSHLILLHEMIHVKQKDRTVKDHGHEFHREMKRLANKGAFRDLW